LKNVQGYEVSDLIHCEWLSVWKHVNKATGI